MVIEIFALSILRAGPVHGYELKQRVQRPSLTPLSNNSLYPLLRRFEADGLVTKSTEEQEGKPARNVYSITDVGIERLRALLGTLPPELAANDEEFLVRVSFFHELPDANRRAILAARRAALAASRAQVTGLLDELQTSPRTEWRERVMTRVLETQDDELRWIDDIARKAEIA